MLNLKSIYLFLLLLSAGTSVIAQTEKESYFFIDRRREGIDYVGEQALPAAREFLKTDSNYYVGWMFLGTYQFDKASDLIGFKNAAQALQKAMDLIERNRSKEIASRNVDFESFFKNLQYQRDYDFIAYCLYQCYSNLDEIQKAWTTLQRVHQRNMLNEYYCDALINMSWHVHRNRFYTDKNYSFLKENLDKNLTYSQILLDSQVAKIERDDKIKKFGLSKDILLNSVYHYRSILYSYDFNLDSAQFYYDKLKNTAQFPANNYATFCTIGGKFREAEHYYNMARFQEGNEDKRLHEYIYYKSIIDIYKNNTKNAIQDCKGACEAYRSSPGFGWYNIALARSLFYDGDINGANYYIDKAANFKEIHIGTTLGEVQYNFSISLLRLMCKDAEIRAVKFANKRWYFSPAAWLKIIKLLVEKNTIQYVLTNQLAANPERDNVVYKLFSSESTVGFDEIWFLVKDFDARFFIDRFKKELIDTERPLLRKYFKLFLAKIYVKENRIDEAAKEINEIIRMEPIDEAYEKLFKARLYECSALIESKRSNDKKVIGLCDQLYECYPQLLPYTKLRTTIYLQHNANKLVEESIISGLKNAAINFSDDASTYLQATVSFRKNKNENLIEYQVKTKSGKVLVEPHSYIYTDKQEAIRILQLALFNIGINYKNLNQESKIKEV